MPKVLSCKICDSPNAPTYLKGFKSGGKNGKGWNASESQEAAAVYGESWDRQTVYKHLKHLETVEQSVIHQAKSAQRAGLIPYKTTNSGFLEKIRDIGMARAMQNPDDITIDQALKAAQILETKKDKGQDSLAILVQFSIGSPPPIIIEGQATLVEEGEYQDA